MNTWYAPVLRSKNRNPEHISFGDRDCIEWILRHGLELQKGEWPPDTRYTIPLGEIKRGFSHNGYFVTAVDFIAEVRRRLAYCGQDGWLVEFCYTWEMDLEELAKIAHTDTTRVSKRISRALYYITTNRFDKRKGYKEYCEHGYHGVSNG